MKFVFDEEAARARKKKREEEIAGQAVRRFTASAGNSITNLWNLPANIGNAIDKKIGLGNDTFSLIEKSEIPEAKTIGDKIANVGGSFAGELLNTAITGAATGGLAPVAKAGNLISSGLSKAGLGKTAAGTIGKVAGSALAETAVEGVGDVARGLADEKSAGEIAKDIGTTAAFNLGTNALLKGLPEIVKSKKTVKAAKEAAKADEIAKAIAKADDVVDDINAQILKKLSKAPSVNTVANVVDDLPVQVKPLQPTVNTDFLDDVNIRPSVSNLPEPDFTVKPTVIPNALDDIPTSSMNTATPNTITSDLPSAGTFDDIVSNIGERNAFNNIYDATADINKNAILNVNGTEISANKYMDAIDEALPNNLTELENMISVDDGGSKRSFLDLSKRFQHLEGTDPTDSARYMKHAIERKLEWLKLQNGEGGNAVRGFVEKRLKGLDDVSSPEFLEALAGRADKYTPKSDAILSADAMQLIGTPEKANALYNKIMRLSPDEMLTDTEINAAKQMLNDFAKSGDIEKLVDLTNGLSRSGTNTGRALRQYAMQSMKSPETVINAAQKEINRAIDSLLHIDGAADEVNEFLINLSKRIDEITESGKIPTANDIENLIDGSLDTIKQDNLKRALSNRIGEKKALAERIIDAVQDGALDDAALRETFISQMQLPHLDDKTASKLLDLVNRANTLEDFSDEQAEIYKEIYRTLGELIPVSFVEKLQSWRKLAMLFNPKTHLRNVLSNIFMVPIRKADDAFAQVTEGILSKFSRTADFGQTRQLAWSATEHGKQIADTVDAATRAAAQRMTDFGKYDISDLAIRKNRPMFGKNPIAKVLNKAADLNAKSLEVGDQVFFNRAYKDVLGQYMTARGLTEVTEEASEFALKRSLETTFRADNAISDVITKIKNSPNKIIREGADYLVPFSKTPSNLLVQAYKYSPANLGVSAAQLVEAIAKKGATKKAVADIINDFAKGMTGTSLFALGMYLGANGFIDSTFRTGKKQRAADEIDGAQQYALKIGGQTISINWIQPLSAPLLAGSAIGQAFGEEDLEDENGEKRSVTDAMSSLWDTLMTGPDSVFENSFMQTFADVLGGGSASEMTARLVENAISQNVPTIVGQAARTIDPVQRRVRTGNTIENMINSVRSKLPGVSKTLDPELDMFGNTVTRNNTNSSLANAFNQIINPATVRNSTHQDDPYVQAMMEIYRTSGKSDALPSTAKSSKNEKAVGEAQYSALTELLDKPNKKYKVSVKRTVNNKEVTRYVFKSWNEMTQEERIKILGRIFQEAKTNTEEDK